MTFLLTLGFLSSVVGYWCASYEGRAVDRWTAVQMMILWIYFLLKG